MANKIKVNQVYRCTSPSIASASVHVIGGSVTVKGSNVIINRNYLGNVYTQDELPTTDINDGDTYEVLKEKIIVTWYDDKWNSASTSEKFKVIAPEFAELVDTGDTLDEGIHLLAGLPEWIGFEGSATEIWVKAGLDVRFINALDDGE